MQFPRLTLLLPIFALAACGSSSSKTPADSLNRTNTAIAVNKITMSCSDVHPESPTGSIVNTRKTNGIKYVSSWTINGDSLYFFQYVPDTTDAKKFEEVDVMALALKDIDPSTVKASEYDMDLTDGGKLHETAFFIHSKNDAPVFKNRIYSCLSGEYQFTFYDIYLCNFNTSSMEMSKKTVEEIKGKLPK